MQDDYLPPSPFLRAVIAEKIGFGEDQTGLANLAKLMSLTMDSDPVNRDWATLLLGQEGGERPGVRDALLRAAEDGDLTVRAEAMSALAQRDPSLALPFVQAALRGDAVVWAILQAAEFCAHPSLVDDLRAWAKPTDRPVLEELAQTALDACLAESTRR